MQFVTLPLTILCAITASLGIGVCLEQLELLHSFVDFLALAAQELRRIEVRIARCMENHQAHGVLALGGIFLDDRFSTGFQELLLIYSRIADQVWESQGLPANLQSKRRASYRLLLQCSSNIA
jgi:hypothetical protein